MNIMLPSSDETGEIRLVFDTVSPLTSFHVLFINTEVRAGMLRQWSFMDNGWMLGG